MVKIFLLGTVLGLVLGLPIGPIGIVVARRMVLDGMKEGFATIIGTLMGDLFYGAVVLFNLHFVIDLLLRFKIFLELFVVVALLYIGITTLREARKPEEHVHNTAAVAGDWFSAFLMSLATIQTPFIFAAVYAILNVNNLVTTAPQKIMILVGLGFGVFLWWALFAKIITMFKRAGYLQSNKPIFTFFGWMIIVIAVLVTGWIFIV